MSVVRRIGRYEMWEPIASGGMATVHLGRILGPAGFSRTVAIKRLHDHLAHDPEFVTMFLDEARLAARIQHPNVVSTLDVVAEEGELFLVMDYVPGDSLSPLIHGTTQPAEPIPLAIVSSVMSGVLNGLHAAHEARTDRGDSLDIVHRDVSPQNILVGVDGIARIADFGIAKAVARMHSTQDGKVRGKLAYMAPEQLNRGHVDRRTDIYATGVSLWEMVASKKLFTGEEPGAIIAAVLSGTAPPMSELRVDVPSALDEVVRRATAIRPDARYPTALEFLAALEAAVPPSPSRLVAAWVIRVAGSRLEERRRFIEDAPTASRVTFASSGNAPRAKASPALSIALLLLMLLCAGAIVSLRQGSMRSPSAAAAGPAVPSLRAGAPGSVEPPLETASWTPTAASLTPSAHLSENSAAKPISPHAGSTASAMPPVRSAAANAQSLECNPPFTLEANGVKRFKRSCL
jgi:serine/threonine protein kinase